MYQGWAFVVDDRGICLIAICKAVVVEHDRLILKETVRYSGLWFKKKEEGGLQLEEKTD